MKTVTIDNPSVKKLKYWGMGQFQAYLDGRAEGAGFDTNRSWWTSEEYTVIKDESCQT